MGRKAKPLGRVENVLSGLRMKHTVNFGTIPWHCTLTMQLTRLTDNHFVTFSVHENKFIGANFSVTWPL